MFEILDHTSSGFSFDNGKLHARVVLLWFEWVGRGQPPKQAYNLQQGMLRKHLMQERGYGIC